jgi:hypothetical protein
MIDRLTGHTGNTTTEPANTLLKYSFISLNNIRQKLRYLYGIKHLEVKLPHKKEMWQEQPTSGQRIRASSPGWSSIQFTAELWCAIWSAGGSESGSALCIMSHQGLLGRHAKPHYHTG